MYGDFEYKAYSFQDEWIPVNSKTSRSNPNFYTTLISALPRPYRSTGISGTPISEFTIAVNEDGANEIRAHGNYSRYGNCYS
jgi:hypothetical protein